MKEAALASLAGMDPLEYLRSSGEEYLIRGAIARQAIETQLEWRSAEVKAVLNQLKILIQTIQRRPFL